MAEFFAWLGPVGFVGMFGSILLLTGTAISRFRTRQGKRVDALDGFQKLTQDLQEERTVATEGRKEAEGQRDAAYVARDVAVTQYKLAVAHILSLEQHINEEIGPPPPSRPEGMTWQSM